MSEPFKFPTIVGSFRRGPRSEAAATDASGISEIKHLSSRVGAFVGGQLPALILVVTFCLSMGITGVVGGVGSLILIAVYFSFRR